MFENSWKHVLTILICDGKNRTIPIHELFIQSVINSNQASYPTPVINQFEYMLPEIT
jgi:hypothetical protein